MIFRTADSFEARTNSMASRQKIGSSREGRPMFAFTLGDGPIQVGLSAGAHADEPAGPETLRQLVLALADAPAALEVCTFRIIPHVNPDGEAVNRAWIDGWPDLDAFLRSGHREPPGEDIEFGYPDLRPENEAAARFWSEQPPDLYVNLHGMAWSDGAMLLIERHWAGRTQALRDGFAEAATVQGLRLHDHNRKGDKGFFQIEPGFTTTPEGAMMRAHFLGQGEPDRAALFLDSSMEFVRGLGGDPLCLVTELPLWLVRGPRQPGLPVGYLAWREKARRLRERVRNGGTPASSTDDHPVRPLAFEATRELHLRTIELGCEALGTRVALPR